MKINQRKLILTILMIYTALIVYFLFFGVGRPGAAIGNHEYRFNLIPNILSLGLLTISPFESFQLWFFNFGNFAGFIPFGLIIPILYRCKFPRFILLFFASILILETMQMLTFLGSFDINDAIVNTLGAAVGFFAYKIGFRFTSTWKNITAVTISVVMLSIVVIGFSELLNKAFTKVEGPVIALNEHKTNNHVQIDHNLQSFEIGHQKIEPKINLISVEGDHEETLTYAFGGKDIVLSYNYGIPENASDNDGKVIISVNGQEVETYSNQGQVSSELNLEKVKELTITIKGNAKLWDVTLKEMKYWWN